MTWEFDRQRRGLRAFLADGPGFTKARALQIHSMFKGTQHCDCRWPRGGRRAREEGAVLRARGWTALDVRLRLLNFPVVLEAPGSSGKQRHGLVRRIY